MRRLSGVLLAVVFLALTIAPASAQDEKSFENQWYWGAQGGYYLFRTPTSGVGKWWRSYSVGGHWLITARRMGLFLSIDQVNFEDGTTSAISDGSGVRTVTMGASRIVGGELVAMPSVGNLQIIGGLGLNIQHIFDAEATGSFASPAEEDLVAQLVADAASKAFVTFSAGFQYNYNRWGFYGKYTLMPQASDFLITGEMHWFSGGIRYALARAREDVVTER